MENTQLEIALLEHINNGTISEWNDLRETNKDEIIEIGQIPIINKNISNINLSNLVIKKFKIRDSDLIDSSFENTVIEEANIEDSRFQNVSFDNATLDGINFSNIDLSTCSFSNASLKYTDLSDTDFTKAIRTNANFENSIGLEFSYREDRNTINLYEEKINELSTSLKVLKSAPKYNKADATLLEKEIEIYSNFIADYRNKIRIDTLFEQKIKKISLGLTDPSNTLDKLENKKEKEIKDFYGIANGSFFITIIMFAIYICQIYCSTDFDTKNTTLSSGYMILIFPIIFSFVVSIIFYGMATKRIREKQEITDKQIKIVQVEAIMKAYVHLYNESHEEAEERIETLLNNYANNILGVSESNFDTNEDTISIDRLIKLMPTLMKTFNKN